MFELFNTVRTLLFGSIVSPLIWLLFTVAFVYFLWGVVRYIANGENEEERSKGTQHMLWGVIGLAIMLSAFGIAAFVYNSVATLGDSNDQPPTILQPGNQHF